MANDKQRRTVAAAVALLLATVGIASLTAWHSPVADETLALTAEVVKADHLAPKSGLKSSLKAAASDVESVLSHSSDSDSDSVETRLDALEDKLDADSESSSELVPESSDRIDELADEITELEAAQDLTEARLSELEDDAEALAAVSSFSIESYKPANGYRLPGKVIEYRGRTQYTLEFKIRQLGLVGPWGNILLVGDTSGSFRSPGLWTYPNSRRLHVRQRGETDNGDLSHAAVWNRGCDPATAVTPPIGTEYAVKVVADHHSFRVYYNGAQVCHTVYDVLPPPGQQTVWIGRPGTAANAEVTEMHFAIS